MPSAEHIPEPGGYERRIGRYGQSLARAFIRACALAPPARVLDVGCGSGALTVELAGRLGAGSVAALDPEPQAVEICARRVPGADVRVGEAERLPFTDGEFDAALAQLVVAFMADAEGGAGEMRRVVRDGGVVAACVWDFGAGMTALRGFWDAAAAVDPAGAARHDQAASHAYTTAEGLDQLWRAAGLRDIRTGALEVSSRYADYDDLWEPLAIPDGAPGRFLQTLSETDRDAIRTGLFRRMGEPQGPFELTARAWYVTGVA